MRVYISGPMTGLPNFNHDEFNRVAAELRNRGYEVLNPAETKVEEYPLDFQPRNENDERKMWQAYMREAIRMMMDADVIVTLPGWEKSRGAKIEVILGNDLGIPVYAVGEFMGIAT